MVTYRIGALELAKEHTAISSQDAQVLVEKRSQEISSLLFVHGDWLTAMLNIAFQASGRVKVLCKDRMAHRRRRCEQSPLAAINSG